MLFVSLLLSLVAGNAFAQGSAEDQAAVWAAVEAIWTAEESGREDWAEGSLTADFTGWPAESPAPRSKASTSMWARFEQGQAKGLAHELFPLSIIVHGDTAVVHYLYTMAVQKSDRTTVVTNGRFTDVLVRDSGSWQFLAWHGGDDTD